VPPEHTFAGEVQNTGVTEPENTTALTEFIFAGIMRAANFARMALAALFITKNRILSSRWYSEGGVKQSEARIEKRRSLITARRIIR